MLKLRRHFCSALPEKLVYKDIRKADRIEYPTLDIELNSLPKLKPGKELNAPVVEYSTLKNGLRIVSQETYGQASTIGLFVNAGSRYENKTNAGINHMMQHMSFKSSDSRSHGAFVQQLEDIGASVTANGSREQLIYTMDVLRDHIDSGMEMLADSVLNPLLVESELKGIRNILKYEHENEMEDPQAFVQEIVHQAAYGNDSPLGRKCMAQKENIDKLSKDMVLEYRNKHFVAEKMVLCGAGVNHERLVALANKYFSQVKQGTDSKDEKWITPKYTGGQVQLEDKSLPFAYGAMAFETKGWHDEDLLSVCVLQTLLGGGNSFSAGGPGKGMYSRLYTNVLNRYYWVESATAFTSLYSDSGLLGIYGASMPENATNLMAIMCNQFTRIATEPVLEDEFCRAKNQLKSSVLMNLESRLVLHEDIGRQVLTYGVRKDPTLICEKIDAITKEDLLRVARKAVSTNPSIVSYGNLDNFPKYEQIQYAIQSELFKNR